MLRRVVAVLVCLSVTTHAALAQNLRDKITQLFSFGSCGQPLCLDGSVSAANGHGEHFIGSVEGTNKAIITFLTEAVGVSLGNVPLSAASSGATFTFVDGLPVKSSSSAGPVFGERAQTLGRKRLLVGANVTSLNFTTLRGLPIRGLNFNFTHQDVGAPGLGDPLFEDDVISVRTSIDLNLLATSAFFTYGLFDNLDVSVAVPYVYTTLRGSSVGQINPFGPSVLHFFAGSQTDPILRAASAVDGTASGIGDVAGRIKLNLSQAPVFGFSLLADARFPTGDEENLLGSGALAVRGMGVMSGQYGAFSPHLNAGYLYRGGKLQTNALLATFGFDQLLSGWATMAADLITERQVGDNKLRLPGPVEYEEPFRRFVSPTDIPNRRDNLVNASLGMKFTTTNGMRLVINGIFPIERAGLQPDVIWTSGLEYTF